MYNNNFDGDNGYQQRYAEVDPTVQPKPKKAKKVLKCIGAGVLALAFTAMVSVGSIWGYVQLTREDSAGGSTLESQPPKGSSHTVTQTIYVQPEISTDGVLTTAQVYNKAVNWVVAIHSESVQPGLFGDMIGSSSGTGMIYREDGYILTNAHVVDGAKKIQVTLYTGESYDAEVVGSDADIDLALLKIDAKGLPVAEFGNSDSLVVGEPAIVVGNPMGSEFANTCTEGIISYNGRAVAMDDLIMDLIQVDAAVSPGNSGGPLLNNRGQVVGVISAKIAEEHVEGIGFAIPANTAVRVAEDFLEYGYYRSRPMIGMTVQSISQYQAQMYNLEPGITVMEVTEGGAAQLAGVQKGDRIKAINGEKATSAAQLNFVKERSKVGDVITLTVEREGKLLDLELVLQGSQQDEQPAMPLEPSTELKPVDPPAEGRH